MTCSPTPPPLYGVVVKVQVGTKGRKTLDSRPQVINMNGYCESVGFGGFFCFTRKEDDPQSQACDYLAMGQASDTGRWGPTWTADGKACTENNAIPGCQNHPANQFLAIAKGGACSRPARLRRSRFRRTRVGRAAGVVFAAWWKARTGAR